jgi:hypothetical protein
MGRGQIEKDIVIYSLIINSNNYVKFYDCLANIKVYYTMFFSCVYTVHVIRIISIIHDIRI